MTHCQFEPYDHQYFDALYRLNSGDPWQYEQRWYEKRKREITLAVLPKKKFSRGIEIGCSNGVLSEQLAERCAFLYCMDAHITAVELAQARLNHYPHFEVDVVEGIVPQALPDQCFDLIVLSEILYYLTADALNALIGWLKAHLSPEGVILACHWRKPITGFDLDGEKVHIELRKKLSYCHYLQLEDADFLMDVWSHSKYSLAQQEGLE